MTATATTAANIKPMLAQPIDEHRVAKLVSNDRWACEPKVDGHRVLIHVHDHKVNYIARSGLPFEGVTGSIRKTFGDYGAQGLDLIVDGEFIPSTGELWLFDCMKADDHVSASDPFDVRRGVLERLRWPEHIKVLPSCTTEIDKAKLILDIKKRCAEGVIFRDRQAPYLPKRCDRLLKYKFRYTCDVVISDRGRDGKDNFGMEVYDPDGSPVDVGTVSALTGDGPSCDVGDVVEVTYLYASDDDKLTQPVTPRRRTDKSPAECTLDQLIYPDKSVRGI